MIMFTLQCFGEVINKQESLVSRHVKHNSLKF